MFLGRKVLLLSFKKKTSGFSFPSSPPHPNRKPSAPLSGEPPRPCATDWEVARSRCPGGAPWCRSWSQTSRRWRTTAPRSATSGTGSHGPPTSRACCCPCSCLHTWPCGSCSSCAGSPKRASPGEAPSPPTTSSPNWSTKLRFCRASCGSTRGPAPATHRCPARPGRPPTRGGCILQPFPSMTLRHRQTSSRPPFLIRQQETCAAPASSGLPSASFWTGPGPGSPQRPSITTLSEVEGAPVGSSSLFSWYLCLKYQQQTRASDSWVCFNYKLKFAPLMLSWKSIEFSEPKCHLETGIIIFPTRSGLTEP